MIRYGRPFAHHLFAAPVDRQKVDRQKVDREKTELAWRTWLDGLYG
ncbi:MAG: hypothetical protein ABR926_23005 [Streptosporangiaceae bacterium]